MVCPMRSKLRSSKRSKDCIAIDLTMIGLSVAARYGLLRRLTTVLTSITRRIHCVGRDQAVGGSLPCQWGSRKECPRRKHQSILTWKTTSQLRPYPVSLLTPPLKLKNKSKPSYPLSSVHLCIHTVHRALVR